VRASPSFACDKREASPQGSEATKQSIARKESVDCFVARAPRNDETCQTANAVIASEAKQSIERRRKKKESVDCFVVRAPRNDETCQTANAVIASEAKQSIERQRKKKESVDCFAALAMTRSPDSQ
jgi:hypothetical protein